MASNFSCASASPDDRALAKLAEQAGTALKQRGRRLCTAESCTGGWLAKCMTDVAGSSAWFERGFVTYSNASKQELLGVDAALLDQYGAVSAETVEAMAAGALRCSRADLVVAISGIAGPGNDGSTKPVGTVWFAWQWRDAAVATHCDIFPGDRDAVRRQAVATALRIIVQAPVLSS